ncbi:MAG TPA: protein kinase [Gemmatimonadales bacterium]|nr:protein kinase [Gemmatimonadales bacterium]
MNEIPARLADALRDRYRFVRELGSGGMGSVYLAEDLKHHRKVAVKVLHPHLAASLGTERFLREIEVAAQLQHPAILPLHDSGEAEGYVYYIMPFVEGESLRARLARQHELSVEDAARILYDVLDALAYAHERGVIHRDIKPDNIMLSGRHALLVDFGVAKAVNDSAGPSFVTTTGLALGTPSYMAPEQAVADREVDHRADLYAVGVVGYELLAGRRPFPGNTAQQIVAAQLTQSPEDLRTHRPTVPPPLSSAIMRALERRPADRWQTAGEMHAKLEPWLVPSGETTPATIPVGTRVPARRNRMILAIAALVLAAVVAGLLLVRTRGTAELSLGRRVQITLDPGMEIEPAVSPDGRLVAFAAGPMQSLEIKVRRLDGGTALTVAAESERPQRFPSWSPDGGRIMFGSPRGVEIVSALGGPAKLVVPYVPDPNTDPWLSGGFMMPAGWSPDGKSIAFVRGDTLYLQDLSGAAPKPIANGGEMHSFAWSPDGRWIACVRGNRQSRNPGFLFANLGASGIWLVPVAGGKAIAVTGDEHYNASPSWSPDSRGLLFVSNRGGGVDLYQASLRANGSPYGEPLRLTNGLRAEGISLAANGRWIVWSSLAETSNVWSLALPKNPPASIRDAQPVTSGNQVIESFDVSADGRWIAFDTDRTGNQDIFRQTVTGGEPERLTEDAAVEFWPRYSPKTGEIAWHGFLGARRHLFVMAADGRDRQQITDGPDDERCPTWSPDGRTIYYLHNFNAPDTELRAITRGDDGSWSAPRTLYRGSTYPPMASPDGRWVAIAAAGSVVIVSPAGDSTRVLVPRGDGPEPRAIYVDWSDDSKTIYYLAVDPAERASIWGVSVSGGPPRLMVRFDEPTREWHRFGFVARHGRLWMTVGDRQSDLWAAEVGAAP